MEERREGRRRGQCAAISFDELDSRRWRASSGKCRVGEYDETDLLLVRHVARGKGRGVEGGER